MMAVDIVPGTVFTAGVPKLLFKTGPVVSSWRSYVPSKDGKRFLMNLYLADPDNEPATILINWDRDLPTGN